MVLVSIKETAPKLYYKVITRPGSVFHKKHPGESFDVHPHLLDFFLDRPEVFIVEGSAEATVTATVEVEASAPTGAEEAAPEVELSKMLKADLVGLALDAGIEVDGKTKAELIASLQGDE